jgi:hypothetical protein
MAEDGVQLIVDGSRAAFRLPVIDMGSLGWNERSDLQRWLRANPDIVAPDLLLVTEELDRWTVGGGGAPVKDRLDLLFIDADGGPLVAELKVGTAPDRTESQALQYAGFVSRMTTVDLVRAYAKHHGVDGDAAREALEAHAPSLSEGEPGRVRVRLVAEDFPVQVTSTVLFLRDLAEFDGAPALDIGCVKLTARGLPDGAHVLDAQPLIPLPETEELIVKVRQSEAAADRGVAGTRRKNAVPLLQQADVFSPGTPVDVNYDWIGKGAEAVRAVVEDDPDEASAVWTGGPTSQQALEVGWSDDPVSLDRHYNWLRTRAGLTPQAGATRALTIGTPPKSFWDHAQEFVSASDDAT